MTKVPTRDQVPQVARHQLPVGQAGTPRSFGAVGQGGGMTGKDVLRILLKRFWLILITSSAITGAICVATLIWWLYAPLYTAVAQLRVTAPVTSGLRGAPTQYGQDIMNRLMQTHAAVAMSSPVLTAATRTPEVTRTAWFNKNKEGAVDRLFKEIKVSPQTNTDYIRISMTARAANDAQKTDLAEIVNAVAREFEKFSKQSISRERTDDIDNLRKRREGLERELARTRRDVQTATRAGNIQEMRNVLAVELRTLTTQIIPLSLYRAQAEAQMKSLQDRAEAGDESLYAMPEIIRAMEMDGQLRMLRSEKSSLEAELDRRRSKFGEAYEGVKSILKRLDKITEQVAERETVIRTQAAELLRSEREAALDGAITQLTALQERFQEAQAQDKDLQNSLTRIEQLTVTEETLQKRIADISDREMDLQLLAGGEEQVRLQIPAIPPREISMPKWKIMLPLGVFLGIACGVGLAVLLEFIDTSIKSPSDIVRKVDLPLLGIIPHVDDIEEELDDVRLAFLGHPNSLVCEAFRQIRTCVLFSGPPSERRSLLVTSALPQDGRTTVTLNLAASFAQGGKRVLVVDANFRQPAVKDLFPACGDAGLSNALVGQAKWQDMTHEVQPNLHVISAGVLPPTPADLLGSEQMKQMLSEMMDQYDQVLIDSAPCLVVSDSSILSTLVDGVILVVRAEANTYGIVQRARELLGRLGAHITGATLNGVRVAAGGYLQENYDTFYEYHESSRTNLP